MSKLPNVWIMLLRPEPIATYTKEASADELYIPAARLRALVEKMRAQSIGYLNALEELEALLSEGEG